jgi:N6-L-threonylcarbamoyladenine synthase
MYILSIESSCDETAAAVVDDSMQVYANIVYSQSDHAAYGGVVPELASRAHMRSMVFTVREALRTADVTWDGLSGIAVTHGPGLVGSLIVGVSVAKGIAMATRKPLVGVHHMEGHIFSNLIAQRIQPPFLTLLVSGGHTELICVEELGSYKLIGRTRDDAAGEAFDKVAKLLGLLPSDEFVAGGRIISEFAEKGDPNSIRFPRALVGHTDFSFSGVKTAVLNYVRSLNEEDRKSQLADICASFQSAVIDSLVSKTVMAIQKHGNKLNAVCIAGGVAANRSLRESLRREVEDCGLPFFCPDFEYCTDNAAMIGAVGVHKLSKGLVGDFSLDANPRLTLC